MVANPIYGEQSAEFNSSVSVSVAVNPRYGTRAEVFQAPVATYEDIKDFLCSPKGKPIWVVNKIHRAFLFIQTAIEVTLQQEMKLIVNWRRLDNPLQTIRAMQTI